MTQNVELSNDQQRALRAAALAYVRHVDRTHGVTNSDLMTAHDRAIDVGVTSAQIDAEIERCRGLTTGPA